MKNFTVKVKIVDAGRRLFLVPFSPAATVLAHTLWELDRTGVKASILTDCVGQLRFN